MELIHDRDRLIEVLSGLLKQLDKQKSAPYPIWDPTKSDLSIKEQVANLSEAVRLAVVCVYHLNVGMSEHTAPTSYTLDGYIKEMTDQSLWQLLQPILNREVNKSAKDLLTELKQIAKAKPEPLKVEAVKKVKPMVEPEPDSRYTLINTIQFTVPLDYDHDTQLAKFAKEHRAEFGKGSYYNDDITDAKFPQVSNRLVPGQTYTAKIFQINQKVTSVDNLSFLAEQSALLVGAQGLSVFYQTSKQAFPVSKWLVSFDEKSKLWQDANGYHRVPFLHRDSGGDWSFDLGYFGGDWNDGSCLFCVCD